MQIRVANRQDEPPIRTFVDSQYKESGHELDVSSTDSDLRNVEGNYFGHDGIIVVADEDGKIIGLAAARSKTDAVLALKRFLVEPERKEAMDALLETIVNFAPRMFYRSIEVDLYPPSNQCDGLLSDHGFKQCSNSGSWHRAVKPELEPVRSLI